MTTATSPQLTLTREHIETAISSLQPVHRVMLHLLLLPYMDPTPEDIFFMAQERKEPNMRAGGYVSQAFGGNADIRRLKIDGVPKEWLVAVEYRAKQYQALLREHQARLNLLIAFYGDYLDGLQQEINAMVQLLSTECELSQESLDDLCAQARLAPLTYALKKLAVRAEKQEVEEEDYRRERLSLEYQAHLRRHNRFKKRLEQVRMERQSSLASSLSDEFLAEICGTSVAPVTGRRVKAVQQYVNALAAIVKASLTTAGLAAAVNAGIGPKLPGGSKNEGISSKPLVLAGDLWSQTVQTLAAEPMPLPALKPCDHADGGTKGLTAKLRSAATYELGEDEEVKVWMRTTQCFNCLTTLRSAQQESGVAGRPFAEVLDAVKTRTTMPRKEAIESAKEQAKAAEEAHPMDLEERLRPFTGDDAGQRGADRWW
jgi:hypothetical protein